MTRTRFNKSQILDKSRTGDLLRRPDLSRHFLHRDCQAALRRFLKWNESVSINIIMDFYLLLSYQAFSIRFLRYESKRSFFDILQMKRIFTSPQAVKSSQDVSYHGNKIKKVFFIYEKLPPPKLSSLLNTLPANYTQ